MAAKRAYARLAREGTRYWIVAFVVLVASILAAPRIDDYLGLFHARWWLFQQLSELPPSQLHPDNAYIVLIGDEEHYGPPLNGTSPTDRAYLGTLVANLSRRRIPVIGLDFDMHLSGLTAKGTPGDYGEIAPELQPQTRALMTAIIQAAASGTKVVLANTLWYGTVRGYTLIPTAYQIFGLCTKADDNAHWQNPGAKGFRVSSRAGANISCGYINFPPEDMRLLPPRLLLDEGGSVDGFSYAIANAYEPQLVRKIPFARYFVNFIPPNNMKDVTFAARWIYGSDKQSDQKTSTFLTSKRPVIIGGGWSRIDIGRGDPVDQVDTPIGLISGAIIHANYVEAVLSKRYYGLLPGWLPEFMDILLGAFAAIVFGLSSRISTKLFTFVALIAGLVLLQWLLLRFVGMVLDAFIPIFGLLVHSVLERLLGFEAPHGSHGIAELEGPAPYLPLHRKARNDSEYSPGDSVAIDKTKRNDSKDEDEKKEKDVYRQNDDSVPAGGPLAYAGEKQIIREPQHLDSHADKQPEK